MLYEPEEYMIIVKDGCKIVLDSLKDEVFPQYPDHHFEREQVTAAVAQVYELNDVNVIGANLLMMQAMIIEASSCECEEDNTRHALMADMAKAFSKGAHHVSDTVLNKMQALYNVDHSTARMIFHAHQMGIVADVEKALEPYGKREPVQFDVPDDISEIGPEDFNDTQC